MPYEGEFATYKPIQRLVESERVKKLLGSYEVRSKAEQIESLQMLNPILIEPGNWIPQRVIAIDGSHAEVNIKNGFPGAEASYVTIASVILDVEKMIELDQQRPVDPKKFKTLQDAESIDCALPGCNVISKGEKSAKDSLRKAIFEVFGSTSVFPENRGESLLDTYESLLQYKPITERSQKCPYEDCPQDQDYTRGKGQYSCQCHLARTLYSTDALRIYERMNPAGTNGAIFGEIMQVWETIWLVHILRSLEARKWLSSLRRLAIVLDGPLAVFGQPAWISQAIYKELCRINNLAKKVIGKDILIIGVEKTGAFVDHFEDLDRKENGSLGAFPSQSVGLLTDSYIKKNIIFSDSTRPYGDATYFGRKFFYKTKSGARIVASLPFLKEEKDIKGAEPSQFPRLSDAIGLLERLVSSRYPNALVPLVSANAEAAIPLSLGNKVLESLAKELIAEN